MTTISARARADVKGDGPKAPSRLVLTIDRACYLVAGLAAGPEPSHRAYRLVKPDGVAYDLRETEHGPACDCPDYLFRREGRDPDGCKHVRALVGHGLLAPR